MAKLKKLSSFMALQVEGMDRISFTYNVINGETGEPTVKNQKESFYVVNEELQEHINWIKDFITQNKLRGE